MLLFQAKKLMPRVLPLRDRVPRCVEGEVCCLLERVSRYELLFACAEIVNELDGYQGFLLVTRNDLTLLFLF